MKILLASGSKRRLDLLSTLGHEVKVVPADVVEVEEHEGRADLDVALINAKLKAHHVFRKHGLMGLELLVGADTVVFINNKLLGKASSDEMARSMLSELSGQKHTVATGYCLINKDGQEITGLVKSEVTFRKLSSVEIDAYIKSGDWHDKAGSYGVQTLGAALVNCVTGSINNIIGLPVEELLSDARKLL